MSYDATKALKTVSEGLGKKIKNPGLRHKVFAKWNGGKVASDAVAVLDLDMHSSPIFGMGDADEAAAADAVARKGEPYAYIVALGDYEEGASAAKIKEELWSYQSVVLDLPEASSVAVSTKVNNMDAERLFKKLGKTVKTVSLV